MTTSPRGVAQGRVTGEILRGHRRAGYSRQSAQFRMRRRLHGVTSPFSRGGRMLIGTERPVRASGEYYMRIRWRWVCMAALVWASPALALPGCPPAVPDAREQWSGEAQWRAIQQAGLRYGRIAVQVDNVYDVSKPGADVWYTRGANFLHVRTRDWVVSQLLLIHAGAPVNANEVYEAIRRLRARPYLRAANIEPLTCGDGVVEVRVEVRDAWTLNPDLRYAHVGNATETRLAMSDSNFLGTGRKLLVGHERTMERSSNELQFSTPALANSDWALATQYQDLSDGRLVELALAKPFLLNSTPWGADMALQNQRLDLNYYQHGVQAWLLPQQARTFTANWQQRVAGRGRTVLRAGLGADYEDYRYGLPAAVNPGDLPAPVAAPRTLVGVGPVVSLHQDHYASFTNLQNIGGVEDYNLGWYLAAKWLFNATALGATRSGPNVALAASKGFEPLPRWLVLADAAWAGRRDAGQWRNAVFNAQATAYGQPWPYHTLVVHADYSSLLRPDPENRLYIGGFQALRGYPNFYASGSRRVRVTLADRIVTPVVWLHTFQVGFVVFTDAARVDLPTGQGWSPWYASVGTGLRLGNLRGSFSQVLYFTVAEPLRSGPGVRRGVEFVVGNVLSF